MPNHGKTYLTVNISGPNRFDQTYWRFVKKYSDDQETFFKRNAVDLAMVGSGAEDLSELRVGRVNHRSTSPTIGVEI